MRERSLQRCVPSFVGALHLVKDAPPRQLQTFAFLTPLDFMHVRTLPAAARGPLLFGILPIRLNCLAFESSCHEKNRRARRAPAAYIPPALTARGALIRSRSPGCSLCSTSSSFSARSSSTVRLWL